MPEDRSLDEFAGGGADEDGESGDAGETGDGVDETGDEVDEVRDADETGDEVDEVRDADERNDHDAIDADPATSTATWTTNGAACDRCGDSVSRRWLDDGAVVCAACKEW